MHTCIFKPQIPFKNQAENYEPNFLNSSLKSDLEALSEYFDKTCQNECCIQVGCCMSPFPGYIAASTCTTCPFSLSDRLCMRSLKTVDLETVGLICFNHNIIVLALFYTFSLCFSNNIIVL